MSVSLLRLQNGRIALFNARKDRRDGQLFCMPWVRFSDDEMKSFSRPIPLTIVPGYYVLNNDRVIQLASGRLVVPLAQHHFRLKPRLDSPCEKPAAQFGMAALIRFLFSDDSGHRWCESPTSLFECFPDGHGLQEPGVFERRDGRIVAWCRAGAFGLQKTSGFQWRSVSFDGGLTWPRARTWRDFPSPCSPLSIKRIPWSGDLLAVWNDKSGRFRLPSPRPSSWDRTPLVAALSRDDGRTWERHALIEKEPGQGFCYTALHFTPDRRILLAYCCGGKGRSVPASAIVLDTLRIRRITL
jgi:sialidase-1